MTTGNIYRYKHHQILKFFLHHLSNTVDRFTFGLVRKYKKYYISEQSFCYRMCVIDFMELMESVIQRSIEYLHIDTCKCIPSDPQ